MSSCSDIHTEERSLMLEALESEEYKGRLRRAHRFEEISGGGVFKKIERFFASPSIYIPYLIYAKAGISRWRRTSVELFWGRTIRIPLDDYDALILYMYGGLYGSELALTKFFIKSLGADDVFYDVGANRGFYTFLASELSKEVHVFEPMWVLASSIRKNVREHDRIIVNTAALSDTNGSIDFYVTDSTMVNTINASVAKDLAHHGHGIAKKIVVPTMTIDAYVATHTKPTVLKIDAEGAEEQIIKGGSNFFASSSPVIAMEVWGKDNRGEMSMRAANKLRAMGYRSFRLDGEGDIQEVSGDLSERVSPQGGDNFIFKK